MAWHRANNFKFLNISELDKAVLLEQQMDVDRKQDADEKDRNKAEKKARKLQRKRQLNQGL